MPGCQKIHFVAGKTKKTSDTYKGFSKALCLICSTLNSWIGEFVFWCQEQVKYFEKKIVDWWIGELVNWCHAQDMYWSGWVPKFATGLIYQIRYSSKTIYKWSSCPSAKMIRPWVNHFGKITAWSLIQFLNYAQFDILTQSQIWVLTL